MSDYTSYVSSSQCRKKKDQIMKKNDENDQRFRIFR